MKMKQRPEDFRVEELADLPVAAAGPYALYRLTKWHLGTIEALAQIARAWHLPRHRLGFCGLKDKHGLTRQFLTVAGGPAEGCAGGNFRVEPLGRTDRAAGPTVLAGNRFQITVRDLLGAEADELRRGIEEIGRSGLPNYFDEQRFGSVIDGRFIARPLLEGRAEEALRLVLCAAPPEEPAFRRRIREAITRHWGQWAECQAALPRCSERSIVGYLKDHPQAFARAFELLDRHLRFLYISAYQSYLWNETLARLLRARLAPERLIERRIEHWRWPFPVRLNAPEVAEWRARSIPLPTHKEDPCAPEIHEALAAVLAEEGLDFARLRFRGLKETWFGRGTRPAWLFPREVRVAATEADELNRGKVAVTFECTLPKGAYATLVTRRLFGTWKRGKQVE